MHPELPIPGNQTSSHSSSTQKQSALRQLADSCRMIVWMTDVVDRCVYLNKSVSALLGAGEQLQLADWASIIHPDDAPLVRQVYRQAKQARNEYQCEYRVVRSDGTVRWMLGSGAPRYDAAGEFIGYTGTVLEVSEQHEAHERLAKSEAEQRLLTEYSSDLISHCDPDGNYLFVSPSYTRALGIDKSELIGRSAYDFVHPEDRQIVIDEIQRQIQTGAECNLIEIRKRHRDGHYLWMGTKARVMLDPVTKEKIGTVAVSRDISAEKEVLQELARLAEENKALIEQSPDIMILFDESGRILRANGAVKRMIGYEPEELIGRHHLEFVTPGTKEETKAMVAAMLETKEIIPDLENCWLRKDGSTVYLSWAVRRVADSQLAYATARDVTERQRTRAKLRRANQRLNSILESIDDAFFSVDRNWRLTYANRKTIAFVGVTRDAAIGKVIWDIVPGIRHSAVFQHYQHAMNSGETVSFEAVYEPTGAWVEARAYPHEGGLSVFFHDITARRQAEHAVRESEQRLREMLEITPAGYFLTDAKGTVLDVNPALCALSGYAKDEFIGKDIKRFLPSCPLGGALASGVAAHGMETVIRHKDGHPVYVLLNLSIKSDAQGAPLSLTAFVTDITERKRAEARLEQLASHDPLTGLPNRALIGQRVESLLEHGPGDDTLAVMFIDLDGFKQVNDSMGHASGDILLRHVAHRLQDNTRSGDVIARLGGDEFVVAAHCPEGKKSAESIAQRLLAALTAPFDIEGQEVFVSASIGICMLAEDARSRDLLFQNADTAMYRAKSAGRNCYRFFEAEMSVEAKTRMTLEHSLRRAQERAEFELHYQPRVKLKSMAVVGMEALIRWNHPQLGSIPPMQFIPIAEDRGLIESIGQWVLEEACVQTSRMIKKFGRPLHVSVNLSARQLKCRNLIEQVEAALAKADLPAGLLELELTESALIDDIDESVAVMKRLKALGVLLSVDDFGTGYSGLSYLKRFPFDILKLDRSFVHHQPEGLSSYEFVKALVDMAHALKLSVVAEGVETGEILHLLRDAACDEGQGYLFAKPLPLPELEAFLARLPSRTKP